VCAIVATAVAMRLSNNLLLAMVAGVGTIWLTRQIV
jgi:branched-subunit amino acid transport protein